MSSVRKNRSAIKDRAPQAKTRNKQTAASNSVDAREQLCNGGATGPIKRVSLPLEMITSLRGILLDFDPKRFRKRLVPAEVRASRVKFYKRVIRGMLARHAVLNKAEVRSSGRGLHAILWFNEPVEFTTDADRQRWAAIVKVVQKLLPTDPDCPGITALTRPIGSVNSKNGGAVKTMHEGEPVTAEEVMDLFNQARSSPFRTVAKILFGDDHIKPCPVCGGDGTKLDALDFVGQCYGSCGKVRVGQLFDVFLRPRPSRKEA